MFKAKKIDTFQQVVQGVVYEPNVLDSHGEVMTAPEVEKMAHRFLKDVMLAKSIDAMHDNVPRDAYPIESFIARANDPDGYAEGAWVMSVKVDDPTLWASVLKGDINGFSFEAYVTKGYQVVMVETAPLVLAATEPDPVDGHTHIFAIKIDEDGKIVEGRTSTVNGHSHAISRGTATESAKDLTGKEHSHRFQA